MSSRISAILRSSIRAVLNLLPPSTPEHLYRFIDCIPPLRSFTHWILKAAMPRSIRLPEGVLVLNREDPVVSGALMLGVYEPYFTSVFRDLVKPGMTVVDIGANIGYYSIIASWRVQHGRVIAYEPELTNSGVLKQSIEANNAHNITLVELALGEKNEYKTLYLARDNKGKHSFIEEKDALLSTEIQILSLDESLVSLGAPKIDLIKMDIEGWEGYAFRGMRATLLKDRPSILFEYAPARITKTGLDPLESINHLIELDYTLFILSEEQQTLVPLLNPRALAQELTAKESYVNVYASHTSSI